MDHIADLLRRAADALPDSEQELRDELQSVVELRTSTPRAEAPPFPADADEWSAWWDTHVEVVYQRDAAWLSMSLAQPLAPPTTRTTR